MAVLVPVLAKTNGFSVTLCSRVRETFHAVKDWTPALWNCENYFRWEILRLAGAHSPAEHQQTACGNPASGHSDSDV